MTTFSNDFKESREEINNVTQLHGSCMATFKITKGGESVDFMYRDEPEFEGDSGWRFLSGSETQDYADDPNNWAVCDLNTIASMDKAIIPYMEQPHGTALERRKGPDWFQ